MKRRQVLLLALVLAAAFRTSMVGAIDITGKWNASFDTPIGPMQYHDFVVKDGKLTGRIKSSAFGEAKVLDGKVDGDKVSFVEMMDGTIRVEYSGKIVSADGDRLHTAGRRLRHRGTGRQAREGVSNFGRAELRGGLVWNHAREAWRFKAPAHPGDTKPQQRGPRHSAGRSKGP